MKQGDPVDWPISRPVSIGEREFERSHQGASCREADGPFQGLPHPILQWTILESGICFQLPWSIGFLNTFYNI